MKNWFNNVTKKLIYLFIILTELIIFVDIFVIMFFLLKGGIYYAHIKFFGIGISVRNLIRPLIVLIICVVVKYLYKPRIKVNIFTVPEYYLTLALIIYNAIAISVLLNGYYSFQICGIPHDFSLRHQAVYNTLRGAPLRTTVFGHLKMINWNILGDHFFLFLLLLAPIYYFYQEGAFLIILQTLAMSFASIPLYLIAKEKLKNKWLALFISVSFLIYPYTVRLFFYDFRVEYFAIPMLLFAFYFTMKQKIILSIILLFLSSLTKEYTIPLVGMLGLYILIFKRDIKYNFIWGSLIIVYACSLWFIATKYIMPYFSGIKGAHTWHLLIGFEDIFLRPWKIIGCLDLEKKQYFLSLFKCLGFIPLLHPIIILGSPNFLQNLVTTNLQTICHLWHTAVAIPFIFIGFIYGIYNLLKISKKCPLFSSLITIWIIFPVIVECLHGYYNAFMKPFYENRLYLSYMPEEYKYFKRIKDWLRDDDSLCTINAFLPNLSNRKEIYWVYDYSKPEQIDTDFILYAPKYRYGEEVLFNEPILSKKYTMLYNSHELFFMGRSNKLDREIICFNGLDIFNFKYGLSNVKMNNYIDSGKALSIELYFDGNSREDEFVQIRNDKINMPLDYSSFHRLYLIFEIEDPKIQTVEVVLGLDLNRDGNVDRYIKDIFPEKVSNGIIKWDIDLEGLLEEDIYKNKKVNILELEIYPHKIWNIDCSSKKKKRYYKFSIYRMVFCKYNRANRKQ